MVVGGLANTFYAELVTLLSLRPPTARTRRFVSRTDGHRPERQPARIEFARSSTASTASSCSGSAADRSIVSQLVVEQVRS